MKAYPGRSTYTQFRKKSLPVSVHLSESGLLFPCTQALLLYIHTYIHTYIRTLLSPPNGAFQEQLFKLLKPLKYEKVLSNHILLAAVLFGMACLDS